MSVKSITPRMTSHDETDAGLRRAVWQFVLSNYSENGIDSMTTLSEGDSMRDDAIKVLGRIEAEDPDLMELLRGDQQFKSCQISFIRDVLMRRKTGEDIMAVPPLFSHQGSVVSPRRESSAFAASRDPFLVK